MARSASHYETAGKYALTARQRDILRLIERGLTNGQIAEHLGITLDGAKFHVSEILGKLGATSREEAVALWHREGDAPGRYRRWLRLPWFGMAARLAAGAAVITVAGALAVVALHRPSEPGEATVPTSVPASPTPVQPVTGPITLGGRPDSFAEAAGDLWVGNQFTREIVRLDAQTGAILARIPVNSRFLTVGSGAGSVWVGAPELNAILRLDPATNTVVGTLPFPNALQIKFAATDDAVWALKPGDTHLVRIDPATNTTRNITPLSGRMLYAIAFDGATLWASGNPEGLLALDPSTGALRKAYDDLGVSSADTLSAAPGAVWLANSRNGLLARFDTNSGTATDAPPIAFPSLVPSADATGVWVALSRDAALVRVDGSPPALSAAVTLRTSPVALVAISGALWVAYADHGSIERLDAASLSATSTFDPTVNRRPRPPADFVSSVRLNGVSYATPPFFGGHASPSTPLSLVGVEYGRVLDDVTDDPIEMVSPPADGNATGLPVGTPIYQLNGYDPRTRVAVVFGDSANPIVGIYEAAQSATASTGADVLDIRGKVHAIALARDILIPAPGDTVLISDQPTIARIVDLLLTATWDERRPGPNTSSAASYTIQLQMNDGTTISRLYEADFGRVSPSLYASPDLRDIVEALLPPP